MLNKAKSLKTNSEDFLGKMVKVVIDRPLNSLHPKFKFAYELNYGFIPDTISGDGEELDAYVLGVNEPIKEFYGRVIGVIRREKDDDDKLIVVKDGIQLSDEEIRSKVEFQEKWFNSIIIRNKYNNV